MYCFRDDFDRLLGGVSVVIRLYGVVNAAIFGIYFGHCYYGYRHYSCTVSRVESAITVNPFLYAVV